MDTFGDRFVAKVIDILKLLVLFESQGITISLIDAINNWGQTNVSWSMDTSQGNITSSQSVTLNQSEEVFIIIESNYTTGGVYPTISTVNSSYYNDAATRIVTN